MDMLVTTGGASVGDHDLIIASLQARGMTLDFWQIAMRPGKPLLFGQLGATPVLGLPGQSVRHERGTILFLFLLPALSRLGGLPATAPGYHGRARGRGEERRRADHLAPRSAPTRLVGWLYCRSRCGIRRCFAAWPLADALITCVRRSPRRSKRAPKYPIIRLDSLGL